MDRKARINELRKKRMAKDNSTMTAVSNPDPTETQSATGAVNSPQREHSVPEETIVQQTTADIDVDTDKQHPTSQPSQPVDLVVLGPTDDLKKDIQHYLDKLKLNTDRVINRLIQEKYEASLNDK